MFIILWVSFKIESDLMYVAKHCDSVLSACVKSVLSSSSIVNISHLYNVMNATHGIV